MVDHLHHRPAFEKREIKLQRNCRTSRQGFVHMYIIA